MAVVLSNEGERSPQSGEGGRRLSSSFPPNLRSRISPALFLSHYGGFARKRISARKYRILHVKPLWIEDRYHSRSRSVRPRDISRYQHRGSLRVGDNLPEAFLHCMLLFEPTQAAEQRRSHRRLPPLR